MIENQDTASLATLNPDGSVPETRMSNPASVQNVVRRFYDNDTRRNWKRARVNGLYDGNPPYSASKLRDEGRAERCNANWGTGRSYIESGVGAFYDLATEAPGHFSLEVDHGNFEQRTAWARILMTEADRVINNDGAWDYELQLSQTEMVLHGCGPLFFENPFSVLPRVVHCGDLKVPERTRACTKYWEIASIDLDYYPSELYEFINDPEAAGTVGWDVEHTREVIQKAMNLTQQDGRTYNWEFYQTELKNGSFTYYDETKICRLAHVFWKEFDGRITHAIVERESSTGACKYLYSHLGEYESFDQAIHPMYCDRGNGGYHHSVTGLGVKMYSAMEFENRLLCNLMDGAFAPKVLFKPTNPQAGEKFRLAHHGNFGLLPSGYEIQQMPIQGLLTDGLAMFRASSDLMRSNLSSSRQQVPMEKSGNPVTKYEKQLEAAQQGALSNTSFSRYYQQLDTMLAEIIRRLCNLNSTDSRAIKFQSRCEAKGVPREVFGNVGNVKAVRVIGQGSPFLRKQAVQELTPIVGSLPEIGQRNWRNDYIASTAGQAAVARYNPDTPETQLPTDQQANAMLWVAAMKTGAQPLITSSMNALTYAGTFLNAATQAVQSIQQGADMATVVHFLDICGPAILAHIQRMQNDPLRKQVVEQLMVQWKKLAGITDQLHQMIQQQAAQAKEQAAKTQAVMTDAQIAQLRALNDIQIKQAKTKAQLDIHKKKATQGMMLADARTASDIHRSNAESQAEQERAAMEHEQAAASEV